MNPPRQISPAGLALVKSEENFSSRLYNDQDSNCTGGWGHLVHKGPICGDPSEAKYHNLTVGEWEAVLLDDLQEAEEAVNKMCVGPLNQNEFDALCSLVFNVGAGAFAGSTLLRLLNMQDHRGAAAEFGRWVYEHRKVSQGLINRRKREAELFGKG